MTDTTFIKSWARTRLKINDPAVLKKIERAYSDWYAARQPRVTLAPENRAGTTATLMICESFTKTDPVYYIFALNQNTANLTIRWQKLHTAELRNMPDIALGDMVSAPGFGYSPAGFEKGVYCHDISSRWLRHEVIQRCTDAADKKLSGKIIRITGLDKDIAHWWNDTPQAAPFKDLRQHIKHIERTRIRSALREFLGACDQRALKILRKALFFSERLGPVAAYEWLTGRREERRNHEDVILPAAPPAAIRNRQDIAAIYPGLLCFLRGYEWYSRDMTREIDDGVPRVQVLSKYLSLAARRTHSYTPESLVSHEFVRWLRGKGRLAFDGLVSEANPFIFNLHSNFSFASRLPREWRPRNHGEWRTYQELKFDIDQVADLLERPIADIALDFAKIINRKNLPLDRVIVRGNSIQESFALNAEKNTLDLGRFGNDHSNLLDFLEGAARQIVIPAIARRAAQHGIPYPEKIEDWTDCNPTHWSRLAAHAARLIYQNLSLEKILCQAQRWHMRANRLQTRTYHLEGEFTWPPLFPVPVTSPGGIVFSCLDSSTSLAVAGKRFVNCVGGYTHRCVLGGSHIVEIKNPSTGELALMELKQGRNEKTEKHIVTPVQIEGVGTRETPAFATEPANWLVKVINKGGIPVAWDHINDMATTRRRDFGEKALFMLVGFDPVDPARADNAYQSWHNEMPGLFPDDTLDDYLARTGINALLAEKMPDLGVKKLPKAQPQP